MYTDAFLSDDRKYRYWLIRIWDHSLPVMGNIGVNPSTADEQENDPTIRKDIGFGERLGFGGVLKLNVAALRSTDPVTCKNACDPIGMFNDASNLVSYCELFGVTRTAAAWGRNGRWFTSQTKSIVAAFPELWCWGVNSDGTPRHTLMTPYATELVRYTRYTGYTG
jgi:hypothetical protein